MKVPFAVLLAMMCGAVLISAFGAAPDVVVLGPKGKDAPVAPAQFSHQEHTGITCHQCHPGLYSTPPIRYDHRQMDQGRSCGACHDGHRAVAIQQLRCQDCHVK